MLDLDKVKQAYINAYKKEIEELRNKTFIISSNSYMSDYFDDEVYIDLDDKSEFVNFVKPDFEKNIWYENVTEEEFNNIKNAFVNDRIIVNFKSGAAEVYEISKADFPKTMKKLMII